MASLCKRQQCTIERRGFRQELDSWRHKLIHCVGKLVSPCMEVRLESQGARGLGRKHLNGLAVVSWGKTDAAAEVRKPRVLSGASCHFFVASRLNTDRLPRICPNI